VKNIRFKYQYFIIDNFKIKIRADRDPYSEGAKVAAPNP
jgi:hypothetical protein